MPTSERQPGRRAPAAPRSAFTRSPRWTIGPRSLSDHRDQGRRRKASQPPRANLRATNGLPTARRGIEVRLSRGRRRHAPTSERQTRRPTVKRKIDSDPRRQAPPRATRAKHGLSLRRWREAARAASPPRRRSRGGRRRPFRGGHPSTAVAHASRWVQHGLWAVRGPGLHAGQVSLSQGSTTMGPWSETTRSQIANRRTDAARWGATRRGATKRDPRGPGATMWGPPRSQRGRTPTGPGR